MINSRKVMTSLLVRDTYTSISKDANHNIQHRHYRKILRIKENTYKHKCKKVLKRKLKKYKLRQDGKEDQDIIDVSDTLVSTLFIRSPNKAKNSVELELEEFRPKNYLFRMVRRQQSTIKTTKNSKGSDVVIKTVGENDVLQISPTTEEKKQTNAFKLLMDSRNKSLGSNSPGKEKPHDDTEMQEFIEKKSIKAKRTLILQKMAEEKGSRKKKEIEEQHEKYIKKKMEKRAQKLKSMIINKVTKTMKDDTQKKDSTALRSPLDNIDTEMNGKVFDISKKPLQLVSIFSETVDRKISPEKQLIPNEDEEFLQKLSPSIRKKESMLSYFKKVEKDSPFANTENDIDVIKVKLVSKPKKRGRQKKLSLNRDIESLSDIPENKIESINLEVDEGNEQQIKEIQPSEDNAHNTASENKSKEKRKRKRMIKDGVPCSDNPVIANDFNLTDHVRPRRIVKKPVKYSNDVDFTSSDEELHIFTPKKKKHSDNKYNSEPKATLDQNLTRSYKEKSKSIKNSAIDKNEINFSKEKNQTKHVYPPKPVKLAPIFFKPQPDSSAIEAKQKFLQSGVPEQLKKQISKQKDCNILSDSFPKVVHIQQLDTTLPTAPELSLDEEICVEKISLAKSKDAFLKMLNLSTSQYTISMYSKNNLGTQSLLQKIKESYPRFPVYRTYKMLRSKKKGEFKDSSIFSNLDNSVEILNCSIDMQNDNPDQLTWSDKYKPLSGNEIIGNFESIKEFKKWLVTWTENDSKSKVTNLNDSDSSDYYQSEPDSRDSMKSNNNLLILSGPVGCGKTLCVYAVAAELRIKVIEVNASSKRTGKIMLQDLQEATQSHKVNRGTGSAENSQKSQGSIVVESSPEIKVKKRGRPKKVVEPPTAKKLIAKQKPEATNGPSASQENTRTAMSLILIDDADIVFDQDDGFCSAIMQLVQSSKRPVILITSSLSFPHLQRFLQGSTILKMQSLLPNILGIWLDLMCLADSGTCWPGLGAKFLNFFKGDVRKTINCLQFYVGSEEQILSIEGNSQTDLLNSNVVKLNPDDENSCMSWTDRDVLEDKHIYGACDTESQSIWDNFANENIHLKHMKYPLRIFNVWWSVPKILNIKASLYSKRQTDNVELANNNGSLESLCNVLDTISVCDYFSHIRPETEANMTSHPWYDSECNSVSELENLDYYDKNNETINEISYELVKGSITIAQKSMGYENGFAMDFPGMAAKRQRDRIVSRHTNMTSYLSAQSSLDRKALALDYWSSCRTICRIEKSKTDSNSKRNNRFCHYLKSLSVLCKSDSFDHLANSLNPSGNS